MFIITDDQDIKLGSLDVQPQVRSLLTEKGMFFQNAFVTTPVCCPSRYFIIDVYIDPRLAVWLLIYIV